MKLKTHLPLVTIIVWLIILFCWMMMGSCVTKKMIAERDTLKIKTHDTLYIYNTTYHHDTLRLSQTNTITLKETGETLKVVNNYDHWRIVTKTDTIYRDRVRTDTMAQSVNIQKTQVRSSFWDKIKIPAFFAVCCGLFLSMYNYVKNKR